MNATGLFFLTARPALVLLTSPEGGATRRGWQFSTVERTKRGVQRVVAVWEGVEAAAFVEVHARRLVKGCALNLQLERVRPAPDRDGLAAAINACSLAPERWPSYHADLPVDPSSQPRPLAA